MSAAFFDALSATHPPLYEVALRLGLALLLAAGVGYEREVAAKPAGLRTHMLVGLAAAAFALLAIEMAAMVDGNPQGGIRADPTRVIEAVITGVAFLGAGTIIRSRDQVFGITTGASIWLTGAIGLACGIGCYLVAVLILLLSVGTLVIVRMLERRIIQGDGNGHG
jgi:Uncharacterized membrane protein